jgi:hypothetical protein
MQNVRKFCNYTGYLREGMIWWCVIPAEGGD